MRCQESIASPISQRCLAFHDACDSLCSSSVPALMPCGCARRLWRHAGIWWSSAPVSSRSSDFLRLFVRGRSLLCAFNRDANKQNQLKLSTQSCICLIILVRLGHLDASSLRLRSLSRCSACDSFFFTVLSLTVLFPIEHLVDGLDLHLLVHGDLHPLSITLDVERVVLKVPYLGTAPSRTGCCA